MSSTNRGPAERESRWETPRWVVRRLLEEVWLPPGLWLEPTAGNGRIIQEVNADRPGAIQWHAVESRLECIPNLKRLKGVKAHHDDFLIWDARTAARKSGRDVTLDTYFDVAILNPPFELTLEVLNKCLTVAEEVFLLQRSNWTGSGTNNGKHEFLKRFMPDIYQIPDRVKFLINGKYPRYPEGAKDGKGRDISGLLMPGDSIEYCWYHWPRKEIRMRNAGSVRQLNATSVKERTELEEAA